MTLALQSTHDAAAPGASAAATRAAALRPLYELLPGETARVARLHGPPDVRWRLLDLGLVPGTLVEAVRRSPLGDPTVYRFRGATVALRRSEAAHVQVEPRQQRQEGR